MYQNNKIWFIAFILLALLVSTALYFFGMNITSDIPDAPDNTSAQVVTYPANGIASRLTNLVHSVIVPGGSDLTYPSLIRCDLSAKSCVPELTAANTPPYLSFVLKNLKHSPLPEHQQKADRLMQEMIESCAKDVRYCDRNFFALHDYFVITGNEEYKNAMVSVGDALLMEQTPQITIYRNIPAKWALLYEVTNDEKYKEVLLSFAELFLTKSYLDVIPDAERLYAVEDYVVYEGVSEVVWNVMVPAYRITKDVRYLEYTLAFFDNAQIENHANEIWVTAEGEDGVIKAAEALIEIAEYDTERSELHRERAKTILENILKRHWDTPERPIANGDYGVFTQDSAKRINFQGWLGVLLQKFGEEIFTVYPKTSVQ